MRNILTHDWYETFRRCKRRFDLQQRGVKGKVDRKTAFFRAVGKAAEDAIACTSKQGQVAVILHHIQDLPLSEQRSAAMETAKLVNRERRLTDTSVPRRKQVQFSWIDTEDTPGLFLDKTGWTFYAKPDLVEYLRDERGPIIRIIDDKIASKVRARDRRNLFFFGFVVSKQLSREQAEAIARGQRYELPAIQLVVRPLGSDGPEDAFWYKRGREAGQLQQYRKVIGQMIEAEEKGAFPAMTDWDCFKCPFRHDCAEYAAVEAINNPQGEVPRQPV